jgi:hypothetical protein
VATKKPAARTSEEPEVVEITVEKINPDLHGLIQPIDSFHIDPENARHHPPRNIELLKGSLNFYGQQKPIVVHKETRICKAGNGLLMAAAALGWKVIAVTRMDDDELTANGYAIMDNRSGELSEWDFSALGVQMERQELAGFPMDMLGFDAGERAVMASGASEGVNEGGGKAGPPTQPGATPGQRFLVYLSFQSWTEAHDWVADNMPEYEYKPGTRSLIVDMTRE